MSVVEHPRKKTPHSQNGGRRRLRRQAPAQGRAEGTTVPPVPIDHEELVVRRGGRSGLQIAVAVHSTSLGPALGGVRLWRYASPADGARDALRLARGMTFKAAAAGLDLGGGKGVICAPAGDAADPELRRAMLRDFGDLIESLEGRYITAEDVGITDRDLAVIAERTEHVVGLAEELGGAGDPSPFTARGVVAAIRACAREAFDSDDLTGLRISVVGVGHVGQRLAEMLASEGAELMLSDVDDGKRGLAAELDAEWVAPDEAMLARCDVLAPCALGGAIDRANVDLLRCGVVCGSANNVIADDELAESLALRGVLYAPDFIANAGGLISVYRELRGYDLEETLRLVDGIEQATARILAAARERSITPLAAAHELALERLEATRPAAAA